MRKYSLIRETGSSWLRCEKLISRLRIVQKDVCDGQRCPRGVARDDRRLGDNKIIICLTHCAYKQTYHYGACFSNLAAALGLFFILQLRRLFWPSGRRVIWRVHTPQCISQRAAAQRLSFLITRNQDKRLIIFPLTNLIFVYLLGPCYIFSIFLSKKEGFC
jgi:hypothetical protein